MGNNHPTKSDRKDGKRNIDKPKMTSSTMKLYEQDFDKIKDKKAKLEAKYGKIDEKKENLAKNEFKKGLNEFAGNEKETIKQDLTDNTKPKQRVEKDVDLGKQEDGKGNGGKDTTGDRLEKRGEDGLDQENRDYEKKEDKGKGESEIQIIQEDTGRIEDEMQENEDEKLEEESSAKAAQWQDQYNKINNVLRNLLDLKESSFKQNYYKIVKEFKNMANIDIIQILKGKQYKVTIERFINTKEIIDNIKV